MLIISGISPAHLGLPHPLFIQSVHLLREIGKNVSDLTQVLQITWILTKTLMMPVLIRLTVLTRKLGNAVRIINRKIGTKEII